jgi:ADP-ribosylglycohydrolase
MEVSLPSRYVGAMLGLAVGDALAQPFVGRGVVSPAEYARRLTSVAPLTWTAVTDATLGVASSVRDREGLDLDHLEDELARRRRRGAWRGYEVHVDPGHRDGLSARTAARQVWGDRASQDATAAVRSVPVGLLGAPFVGRASGLARQQAEGAHEDPRVVDSAALLATAVCSLSHTAPHTLSRLAWLTMLGEHVATDGFRQALLMAERWVTGQEHPSQDDVTGTFDALPVHYGVVLALVCFLRHSDDLPEAIRAAVLAGHATTGAAAMTGALAGAYLGAQAVPSRLVERLEDADTIRGLARDLHRLSIAVGA